MGKKTKTPKTPDYQPLINAASEEQSYATQKQDEQFKWAQDAYKQNKETSDKVIASSLETMGNLSGDAKKDRERYDSTFVPLQDDYIRKAKDYASPQRMEVESGKAQADVSAQFDAARQAAQDRLEGYGVDPSQSRSGALDLGTRIAQAAAKSSAGNQARTNTEMIGDNMLLQAIGLGQGLPQQSMAEYGGALTAGNQAVNTGLATTASGANTMGTGLQWGQLGQNALNNWGNLQSDDFKNKMGKFDADKNNSSGWGSLIGDVAGTAAKILPFAAEGGVIPEDASPSGGAITDDISAQPGPDTPPVQVNAGEFIIPKDVTQWLGEKGIQQLILKARKEMTGGEGQRPAQPTQGPGGPPVPANSVGAIPPTPGG
jgi:hypothetical protein